MPSRLHFSRLSDFVIFGGALITFTSDGFQIPVLSDNLDYALDCDSPTDLNVGVFESSVPGPAMGIGVGAVCALFLVGRERLRAGA